MLSKLKNDLLYKKIILSNRTQNEEQAIINTIINYPIAVSLDIRAVQKANFNNLDAKVTIENNQAKDTQNTKLDINALVVKHFHFKELNSSREEYFREFVTQIIYLSLLANRTKLGDNSDYIKPSILNSKDDDFQNGVGISEFDWILLEEFYNNKDLKSDMTYVEIIPILEKSIYLRMKKGIK